jgi:hypothetical protein
MALKFMGKFPEHINDIPAKDLSDAELQALIADGTAARVCSKEVSLAEFEGVLMLHGLYTSVPKTVAKATVKKEEE